MFKIVTQRAANCLVIMLVFLAARGSALALTQKEFALMVVSGFGWSDGLPKEAADRDYLVVFAGKRTFRYEAEDVYDVKGDNVVQRNYPLFGQFSGNGWLMGISSETTAKFKVFVPLAGEYRLKAVIKGSNFVWRISDAVLRGSNPAANFSEVDLGMVRLQPGVVQISATIPPEGGIDAFLLVASDLVPVQPVEGWRFKDQLTALQMAQIGVALMDAYDQLPPNPKGKQNIAAVNAVRSAEVAATTAGFLGTFKAKAWLRAGIQGAELRIPIHIPELGYYELEGQVMGEHLSGDVNGTTFSVTGKPFLDRVRLGMFRLDEGENILNLKLPPMGGIDTLEVAGKSLTPQDVMRVAGVGGSPDRLVTPEEAQSYITSIRGKRQARK